jgi:hypothetical protein
MFMSGARWARRLVTLSADVNPGAQRPRRRVGRICYGASPAWLSRGPGPEERAAFATWVRAGGYARVLLPIAARAAKPSNLHVDSRINF